MPPKKDAKKGAAKELDPSIYIRKAVELDEVSVDPSLTEQLAGKIANVTSLFPVWDDKAVAEEKWSEPLVQEKKVKYPKFLGVTGDANLLKFLNLEPIEVAVDPKAKKDAKKDPKKGAVEAPVELTEVLVDEHGRKLPVIFMDVPAADAPEQVSQKESTAHQEYDILRPFAKAYTEAQMAKIAQQAALQQAGSADAAAASAEPPAAQEPQGGEVDPFLCGAYRLVQRFTSTIARAHLSSLAVVSEDVHNAEKNLEDQRHILEGTFLWRAIYPKLPSGKPVYNPAGKYCVRLYLAGEWRRVFVDDSVPVTVDGNPALAFSSDKLELWPLLLAKAIYAVYSACGYADVVGDVLDQPVDPSAATAAPAGEESPATSGPYPPANLPRAQCIAHFTSFALHVMTGWQPRQAISIKKVFTDELTRSAKLLQAFTVEGVCKIEEDDIVRDFDEVPASERVAQARALGENYSNAGMLSGMLSAASSIRDLNDPAPGEERPGSPGSPGDHHADGDEGDFDGDDLDLGNIAEGSHEHSYVMDDINGVIEPPADGIVRRTKKQFKAEYERRKQHRDAVVARIIERERRIAKVSGLLEQLLTEVFFLSIFDSATQQTRILPVLGLSYPASYKTHLTEVQLLVNWRTSAPVESVFSANPTPDDPETAEIRGVDAGPLPLTTPLDYEWVTIQQLMDAGAFLMSMDTKMLTPFETVFSNPWVPLSSLAGAPAPAAGTEKAAKEKPKGKEKNAPAEVPVVEEYFADPGVMPVTLLRLDTSEFFTDELHGTHDNGSAKPPMFRQSSSVSASGKHHPLKPEVRKIMRKGALSESAATLQHEQYAEDSKERSEVEAEEAAEAGWVARSNKEKPTLMQPVADFLHFTVMIHADAVLEYKEEPAEASTPAEGDAGEIVNDVQKPVRRLLPSGITLVLQEVRTDKVDPLMFVMEMKDTTYLPVMSKSFAVSAKRLSSDPTQPLVFWMRLFSKASVHMHFTSEVGLTVGPAEQVWASIGRPVFLKEGRSEATRSQTQQLVFRLPLTCERAAAPTEESTESKGEEGATDAPTAPPKAARGMTFLHVADRGIDRFISLGVLPVDRAEALAPLPRTQGNIVDFSADPAASTILLGRTFPAALFDRTVHAVPAFNWKLLVLSDNPVCEPVKPINEEAVSQRYTGKFVANNKNALFRDIYSIDKLSFPFAFRLTTAHDRPVTGSAQDRADTEKMEKKAFTGMASESTRKALRHALTAKGRRKDLCLSVKMYRASDMKLVSEFKGREGVICYSQALEHFLPDGETFDVAAALAAAAEAKAGTGKKDAKAAAPKGGAKGAAPTTSDSVDVLIECTLDEAAMIIAEDWQSRYPHVFDCLYADPSPSRAATPAPDAAAEKGKKGEAAVDPQEAIRKNAEIIQAQQACLGVPPPSKTLVKWQLDVLAGKVLNISHDTKALEKEIALKNSWEDSSAGRAEKAAAAIKYYQERRANMQRQLEDASRPGSQAVPEHKESSPSAPGTRPTTGHVGASHQETAAQAVDGKAVTPLTAVMTESLVTALGADLEQLNRRYTILNNIPQQFGQVEVLQKDAAEDKLSFVKPRDTLDAEQEGAIMTQLATQRVSELQRGEARHQDIAERFVKLNTECREEAKQRVEAIVKEANADAIALAQLWEAREKYRVFVEAQNVSLAYLLKRATDAKVVARAAEKKAADEAAALAEKLRKEEEKKAAKKK